MFSTVAQAGAPLSTALAGHPHVFELSAQTSLPFKNRYSTPETLGKDRLAAVAGAKALFPGENCLVIDCGTCIKYDLITSTGEYLGGNIAPGAKMRIQAMHHFTARLPEVAMQLPTDYCGHSTETALQNGALRGASLEIEGFVQLFSTQYQPLRVVLTGGDAAFFQPVLDVPNLVTEADLTLYGLNNILIFNI